MNSGGGGGGGGGNTPGLLTSIGGVVGGVLGHAAASGDTSQAQGYAQDAFQQLLDLGIPPDLAKPLILQKFQQAGIMNPAMEQAINDAHSQVASMQEAPQTRNAQMDALTQLQTLSRQGLGAQDRAALNQIRNQTQSDLQAKQQQILQNAQAQGMTGSGAALIAQLQGAQGGANLASTQGDQIAAQAQNAALSALGQSANLAGTVRGQDYQTMLAKSQAQDELNRFNVQNQLAQQQRNVGAQNQAQYANLQNAQNVSNQNVSAANQELQRQAQAQQTNWLDQMQRAGLRSGAYNQAANEYGQRAAADTGYQQGLYTGIGRVGDIAEQKPMNTANSATGGSGSGASSILPIAAMAAYKGGEVPNYNQGGMYDGYYNKGGMCYNDGGSVSGRYSTGPNYDTGGTVGSSDGFVFRGGGPVPGQANVPGNSIQNDTVDAKLSPGEVVIPRTIMNSDDPVKHGGAFIKRILNAHKIPKPKAQ